MQIGCVVHGTRRRLGCTGGLNVQAVLATVMPREI